MSIVVRKCSAIIIINNQYTKSYGDPDGLSSQAEYTR